MNSKLGEQYEQIPKGQPTAEPENIIAGLHQGETAAFRHIEMTVSIYFHLGKVLPGTEKSGANPIFA